MPGKKQATKKRLMLIDAHALIHRAFHALPPLNTQQGELVNAVFGFFSILLAAIKQLQPEYIAAAFDLPKPTFRHQEFAGYKATRAKAPDELYAQIQRVEEGLDAFNIPVLAQAGFEADDILGTIVKQLAKTKGLEIYIVTGDLDTLQLVGPKVKVFMPKKGLQDPQIYDLDAVKERFDLPPERLVDFKGLKGDPSDNIPGVPGIGEKTAAKLLQEFGSLKTLYQKLDGADLPAKLKEKLTTYRDQAFFSQRLAQIRQDAPLTFSLSQAVWRDFDRQKAATFFTNLKFNSLVARLQTLLGEEKKPAVLPPVKKENPTLAQIDQLYKQGLFSPKIWQLEKDLFPVLRAMEQAGILLDAPYLRQIGQKVAQDMAVLEKKIYRSAGARFNPNSPQQLSAILFDRLKINVAGLKKTPGKVISTALPELLKLMNEHPIIAAIIKYRELAKLKNTYIDALPRLVAADERIHTEFDQLGTATGRLSSKNPNLQNIPGKTALGNKIRSAFLAPRGWLLLSADYSQIELRVVASIAHDREMIKLLQSGHDIHVSTAAAVFGVSEKEVTANQRKAAKVLNFGMIYGMSIAGFAQTAGLSRTQAKEFMQKYFQTFAGVAGYIEQTKKAVQKNGYVQTIFGRQRLIPEINSSTWNLRAAAERMAINMPVQGTAADIIKMAMVAADKAITKQGLRQQIKMILQVHDELVFEVYAPQEAPARKIVQTAMEGVSGLCVPLIVEIKTGTRWGKMAL
ncbi:MAG: hypothetical protein COU85_02875 [Candidatus Portnoybacteria bacterium CG10_big_fil_rev_8_21_14_0_10_44_7]|uniref:DNA-directed DNA polymerase n=1 Tax=Candidatus Portnoybacteria bacterium CG10_big_fil_rev_8_21_14_0_10_44_7 TaxID=1974816 RepID=A0A2M8KI43_9BACT|nr:MAG: hypothetical protein COU85_02875 [Candidatus Portnoybacteria bacterium CG10_big_fil_rev_8_21_14_0_10_44_7]